MNEERIFEYCKKLLADIVMAKECLDCAQMIGEKVVSDEVAFHENLFLLARNSFLYTGTIILCKAFEEDKRQHPLSVLNILEWTEETLKLKKSQKENISKHKARCKCDIVDRLKTQRDKFYAHNDKIDLENLEENYSISYQDKMKIIDLAVQILSYIISLCEKAPFSKYHIETKCKTELEILMNEVAFMNMNKENLQKYIRWCREND